MRVTDYCVGELSALDTGVLIRLARGATRILEFGCGGSTTLWSQFCAPGSSVTSVETVPDWIERTKVMCNTLGGAKVKFLGADSWRDKLPKRPWFDLIFIDSNPFADRIKVAEAAWPLLMPEGKMAWHDAHSDLGRQIFQFAGARHLEISGVHCESAVYTITRSVGRLIGDTDTFEGRAPWESGHAALPEGWPKPR